MKRFLALLVIGALCGAGLLSASDCTSVNKKWLSNPEEALGDLTPTNSSIWSYSSGYSCAVASTSTPNSEAWLITPAFDLSEAFLVLFSFDHAHKFAGEPSEELTLWVAKNYEDDPETADWQQLTIPNYTSNTSWSWSGNTVNVPLSKVGKKTVFGFRYKTTDENHAQWEIKNVNLQGRCAGDTGGDTPAGRLRVCGQNMENYYINYNNSSSSRANYDHAAFAQKTSRIVTAFLKMNADIYALCEVEACPEVLKQLADSLNKYSGTTRYQAVDDGINEPWDSYDNNMKSGFIYRKDKVKPYKSNSAASTYNYYKNTMRIQAFEELSSGERFVLSMNHFKAKTGGGDQGESQRIINAEHLMSALNRPQNDADILIMGDLNCEYGEEPIRILLNNGFTEELLRYDGSAYSHCYSGKGNLIDHAMANHTMAQQIVGTQMYHICTTKCGNSANYSTTYSDHDPYVVDMNLGEYHTPPEGLEDVQRADTQSVKVLINGQLYIILPNKEMYDIMGNRVK